MHRFNKYWSFGIKHNSRVYIVWYDTHHLLLYARCTPHSAQDSLIQWLCFDYETSRCNVLHTASCIALPYAPSPKRRDSGPVDPRAYIQGQGSYHWPYKIQGRKGIEYEVLAVICMQLINQYSVDPRAKPGIWHWTAVEGPVGDKFDWFETSVAHGWRFFLWIRSSCHRFARFTRKVFLPIYQNKDRDGS